MPYPGIKLSLGDIESSWAGIRPLIHQGGKSASEISRKDEIFEAPDGLISIAGGKLTGYRKMAEKTVDLVVKRYAKLEDKKFGPCTTRHIPLTEDPLWNEEEVEYYKGTVSRKISDLGLSDYYAGYLVANYGKQTDQIITLVSDFNDSHPEEALIRAELKFCVENEMVCSSTDFLDRRTGRLSFDYDRVLQYKGIVTNDLARHLAWTNQWRIADEKLLDERMYEVKSFNA